MFSDLLPAIENGILSVSGAVPVVFEGIEHVLEKSTPTSEASTHETHELLYLRDGEIDFKIEGKKFTLRKGDTVIIRPHMVHALKVTSKQADMLILYFGFIPDPKELYVTAGVKEPVEQKPGVVRKVRAHLSRKWLPHLSRVSCSSQQRVKRADQKTLIS